MLAHSVSTRLCLKSWSIVFTLAFVLLAACALLGASPALAVGIEVTDPVTNEVGVDLDADIVATYTAAISPTTVTTRTFVAQGMLSGRRDGTFSFGGGDTVVTLNPDEDYFAGEVVRVSATGGVSDTGGLPVTPYQWQFTAGPVFGRCAGEFADIGAGLPGVGLGSVAWGDYDGDGDLDILLTGETSSSGLAQVWRNNGNGTFTNINAGLPGVRNSSAAWGDYDNDGDLDILLTGQAGSGRIAQVWRNDGGTFVQITTSLPGVQYSSVAWGDYDNDGDLDILLTGGTGSGITSQVWRNNGDGTFANSGIGLPGVAYGSAVWGDYDNDGDLDILLAGSSIAQVWRNDGDGTFSDIGAGLPGVWDSLAEWGDYDNDGDLDILLTGDTGSEYIAQVWRNNGNGTFTQITTSLPGVRDGWVAWGDYDNDGDLDILLTGSGISQVWRNNGNGTFAQITTSLPGVHMSLVAWGDYDNDGDLDILLAGSTDPVVIAQVWRNKGCVELAISKEVTPAIGVEYHGVVTYTVVVSNTGNLDAIGVLLTDTLPAEVDFGGWVGDAHGAAVTDDEIRWSGSVSAGLTLTWTWTATHTGGYGDVVTNTAWYTYAGSGGSASAMFRVIELMHIVSTDPAANAVGADPATDIAATFDAAVDASTVSTRTFAVQGMMGGLLGGAYDTAGDTVTFDPDRELFAGELVRTSLTGGLRGTGDERLVPYQWQFTAGPVLSRCVSGFADIEAGLPGVTTGSVAWGDYDGDGDLDILLTGWAGSTSITQVRHNNGDGTFSDIGAGLPGVHMSSVAWGDYDNDGDLDILLAGTGGGFSPIARLYRNDEGTFSDIGAGLPGVEYSSAAWGDYDNDGDLDILLTGWASSIALAQVWRNDEGTFSNQTPVGLPGVAYSSVAWGDYDNDGDLDILLTGWSGTTRLAQVWRNDGGGIFTNINAGLPGVHYSSVAWGDYDNDGDLDILLTGWASSGRIAQVWRNDGNGTFSDIGAGLPGVDQSSVAWGDYDNDGDLDILLTGEDNNYTRLAQAWRNNGNGTFSDIGAGLPGVDQSSVAWGDYDNDGDLDILLAGWTGSTGLAQVWRNDDCAELAISKQVMPAIDVEYQGIVTYTVVVSNTGGPATGVLLTDTLPAEVGFGGWVGDNHGAVESGGAITWTGAVSEGASVVWSWWATSTAQGDEVTNTAWYTYAGSGGSASATFEPGAWLIYLPVVFRGSAYAPDLVVTGLTATTNQVRMTIQNVGNAPTVDDFWVDVSFDPRVQPPGINQPWPTIANHGVVWGVTRSLGAGESLELVTGGDYYFGPPDSSLPPHPAGATVWAYVDSVNYATTWGAVEESDEGNNTRSAVSSAEDLTAGPSPQRRGEMGHLPPR